MVLERVLRQPPLRRNDRCRGFFVSAIPNPIPEVPHRPGHNNRLGSYRFCDLSSYASAAPLVSTSLRGCDHGVFFCRHVVSSRRSVVLRLRDIAGDIKSMGRYAKFASCLGSLVRASSDSSIEISLDSRSYVGLSDRYQFQYRHHR